MADLSGVLRKTIDGLPRATPQLRAKVYEKARAAIQRQIQSANPPLDESVASARLAALEDAIRRTEAHYESGDAGSEDVAAAPGRHAGEANEPVRTAPASPDRQPASGRQASAETSAPGTGSREPAFEVAGERRTDPTPPSMPRATPPTTDRSTSARGPSAPDESGGRRASPDVATSERVAPAVKAERHSDWGQEAPARSPLRPARTSEPVEQGPTRDVFPGFNRSTDGRASTTAEHSQGRGSDRTDGAAEQPFFPLASEEPDDGARPTDVGAPFLVPSTDGEKRAADGDRETRTGRWDSEGRRLPAGIRSDDDFIPEADLTAPRYAASRKRRSAGASRPLAAAAAIVLILGGLGTAGWIYRDEIEALITPPDGLGTIASNNTAGNASPNPNGEGASPAPNASGSENAAAPQTAAPEKATSTREFTQRLLPDGSEVDEGPAQPAPNAFDEGTNIAAASPITSQPGATPTINSEVGQEPQSIGGAPLANTPAASSDASPAAATPSENAPKAGDAATPAVAQKAVFYQERTQDAAGTQESGNVVWSVVNEPPSDGQPAEPAIRAKVDIPDENLTMTMTIRRNADPTLPASHVIEILFNTPPNFAGGGIANVQRLALKATEQARGEPLIGVAGKISDNFFIIALNNLDQAEQSNLALLKNQQWIDVPIAYATGRRALVSIEKGVPGDEVFKQAMDAWAAKT